jgi:hypothetical protein
LTIFHLKATNTMDLSKSVQEAIDSSVNSWLANNWPWGWIFTHPGLSFLLLLLVIVLFWGLLGAVGRGVQQGWILVLRSPLKLLGLLQLSSGSFLPKIRLPKREQQIDSIMQQLALNQQQQLQLLAELNNLIKQSKN